MWAALWDGRGRSAREQLEPWKRRPAGAQRRDEGVSVKQRLLRGLGAMSRAATAVAVWLLAEVSAARASAAAERSGAVPLGGGFGRLELC